LKERIEQKLKGLSKYFETNEKAPSSSKTAKAKYIKDLGFDLNMFWNNLTKGHNKQLFEDAKKKSTNMKKAYDKFLEKKVGKIKIPIPQRFKILSKYFETNEKAPSSSNTAREKYIKDYGFDLNMFWQHLTKGHNKQLFEDALDKSRNMKKAYDKFLEKKAGKIKIPTPQRFKILSKYFETNEKAPSSSNTAREKYIKDYGFNLGAFWQRLMQGSNKKLFEEAKKKSTNMKKAHDKFQHHKKWRV